MYNPAMKKRGVCGRFTRYPLCDGGHKTAGWQRWRHDVDAVSLGFFASPSLRNLADRLADRLRGPSLHVLQGKVQCEQLVLLTDGHDVEGLQCKRERIPEVCEDHWIWFVSGIVELLLSRR